MDPCRQALDRLPTILRVAFVQYGCRMPTCDPHHTSPPLMYIIHTPQYPHSPQNASLLNLKWERMKHFGGQRRPSTSSTWVLVEQHVAFDMGGCQNYGPFWGTLDIRCRIIIGLQKGTIILTTTHMCSETSTGSR